MSQTPPQVIPNPPDFPVHWDNPNDAQLFWNFAPVFPKVITPLGFDLICKPLIEGENRTHIYYQLPVILLVRRINGYYYFALQTESLPKSEEDSLQAAIDNLGKLWESEWLPDIKQHLHYFEHYDLAHADLPALSQHLDEMVTRTTHLWEVHFLIYNSIIVALDQFETMYQDLLGENSQFTAHQLLAGLESQSVTMPQELWQLSREILKNPQLQQLLSDTSVSELMNALEKTEVGQTFLTSINGYLQKYGTQCQAYYIDEPSWHEAPIQVIDQLKSYLTQPKLNVITDFGKVKSEREKAVNEARSLLASYPQPVVDQFEHLLESAQMANYLREEHAYWLDMPITYHIRQTVLALGQRLQSNGVIREVNDIFYFTYEELQKVVHSQNGSSQDDLITQRRENESHFAKLTPPPMFGTLPTEPPPDHPIATVAFTKIMGLPLPASEQSDVLQGYAGSPGIVKGQVKILHSPEEVNQLRANEILVTTTTTPSWAPIFPHIIGLITDIGGVLCHAAVVARERGIPAVVGTGNATALLKDGQLVEVNGNTGQVRILDSHEDS